MAKPEKTIEARVLLALREAPARGQHDLGRRVLGESYTIEQWDEFASALKWHMTHPATVIEEKRQVPGTGHEGPPVYEYTYRLATAAEKAAYQL